MRLNKLTMCAFGPYKGIQEIQFELIHDKKLFLVTGPTGAGKTSIFDAIAYALYGESSGNGRKADDFISQYSGPSDTTFVELDFTVKGKRCVIKRQPKQEKLKSRGDGTTVKNADAHLVIEDAIFTSVTEVNQKIEELLGIDAVQFRQIVMLPQGEFRKLLEANSSEKEQIFRKIFKTDFYKAFQEAMRDKVRALETDMKDTTIQLKGEVQNLECNQDEALETAINRDDLNYPELIDLTKAVNKRLADVIQHTNQQMDTKKELFNQLTMDITKSEGLNQQFKQLDETKELLNQLQKQENEMKKRESMLVKYNHALFIKEVENLMTKDQEKINALQEELKEKTALKEQTRGRMDKEKDIFVEVEANYKQLDSYKEQLNDAERTLEKFTEYKGKQKQINELDISVKTKYKEIDELRDELKQTKQIQKENDTLIRSLEKSIKDQEHLPVEVLKLEKTIEDVEKELKLCEEIKSMEVEHHKLSEWYLNGKSNYTQTKNDYELRYEEYLHAQAGILAQHLEDGDSCPVCGSKEHPHKAVLKDHVLSLDELEVMKNNLEQQNADVQEKYNAVYTLKQRLEEKINQATKESNHAFNVETFIIEYNKKLQNHYQSLSNKQTAVNNYRKLVVQLDTLKQEQTNRSQKLEDLDKKLESLLLEYEVVHKEYLMVSSEVELLIKEYHLNDILYSDIQASIQTLKTKITTITEQYLTVNDTIRRLNESLIEIETSIKNSEKSIISYKKEFEEHTKTFNTRIENSNFSTTDDYYQVIKLKIDPKKEQETIEVYNQERLHLERVIKSLEQTLKEQEPIDISKLNDIKDNLKIDLDALTELSKQHYAVLNQNKKALLKIQTIYQQYKGKLKEHNKLAYLEKVSTGNNHLKLTFERYVLTAYFDEIIYAANLRLKNMTVGRYLLSRDNEYTGGRGQQGLDLLVLDHYTNKKRNVKTLSGGEAFIASLALALGLADVVSSYAGGIQLDTIFIDEGFGTLDPEALEHAIKTLNNIKESGRLVGIISHVQELKERIEAKLEITPTKEGSLAAFKW